MTDDNDNDMNGVDLILENPLTLLKVQSLAGFGPS